MEEENIELVKISAQASAQADHNDGDDLPRSSMIGGNPFSSILHFTRQLLRGVSQAEDGGSLDAQLKKVASPIKCTAEGRGEKNAAKRKQRRSTYAHGSSTRALGTGGNGRTELGNGDGIEADDSAHNQLRNDARPLERKRGSSWSGSTEQMQQQRPTPKRGSVLGHCATKNADLEAGGVLLRLEDLELMKQLGEGSFGEVFKARLAGVDGLVAAKRAKLQVQKMNLAIIAEVLHECELMYELGKHPHVLPFIGAAVDANGPALYIVSKLMERGSVVDQLYLRKADLLADTADSSGVARGDSRVTCQRWGLSPLRLAPTFTGRKCARRRGGAERVLVQGSEAPALQTNV
jgi:hypothetical protein